MSDPSTQTNISTTSGQATFVPLPGEALVEVTGRDALTFLHNQTSCDVQQLAIGQASHGTFCNPQGRVLADFLLLCLAPEHYRLRLRREILQSTLDALGRFAMFSKVTLAPAPESLGVFGALGPAVGQALHPVLGEAPSGALTWTGDAQALALQLDAAGTCIELWIDTGSQGDLLERLGDSLPGTGSESDWEAAGLRRGIARITAATVGELLPQQLNYDLTGHINFRKGCYPGQEVIARMHYRGKAKRRLLLMQLPEGSSASAGDPLYLADKPQATAQVVNTAMPGDGDRLALVTTTESAALDGLRLSPENADALKMLTLPYPVPFG